MPRQNPQTPPPARPFHRKPPKLTKDELQDCYRQDARALRVGLVHLDRALEGAARELEQVSFLSRSLSRICRQAEEKSGLRLRRHLAVLTGRDPEQEQAHEFVRQAGDEIRRSQA